MPYIEGSLRRWDPAHCILPLARKWEARDMATRPWASLYRGLDFAAYGIDADGIEELVEERFFDAFPWIEHLSMAGGKVRRKGIDLLGREDVLCKLVSLDLSGVRLHASTFGALMGHVDDAPLRTLRLSHCALRDEHAERLAASPALTELRELDLSGNTLGYDAALAILEAGVALEAVDLHGSAISPDAMRALVGRPGLLASMLEGDTLTLAGAGMSDYAMAALLTSDVIRSVRHLKVSDNAFTLETCRALARCDALSELVSLDVSGHPRFDGRGLRVLLESEALSKLETLTMMSCAIRSLGRGALEDGLPALRHLDVKNNGGDNLSMEALRQLIAWPGFARLRTLRLQRLGETGSERRDLLGSASRANRPLVIKGPFSDQIW